MSYPHSSQHDNFLGAVGLMVVAALAVGLMGSFAGFIAIAALIGVLWIRTQWARILTLVIVAYVGLVSFLVSLFAKGESSFAGFLATLIAAAIFWLLLRPGMNEYFGSASTSARGQVVPVAPRPGALPHLQRQPLGQASPPAGVAVPASTGSGSTQEQWARLQQQLRAEQVKEEREATALEQNADEPRAAFPWLTMTFTVMVFAYAVSVGEDFGKASMLLVIPGFIAAMLRWINPAGFLLGVLIVSVGLILHPEWKMVSPEIGFLLQHHGPMVFAAIAVLAYTVALCASGFAGECEDAA